MSHQPSLFDPPAEVERARDLGIATAAAGASPSWKAAARTALRTVAAREPDFTADDVLAELERMGAPRTPNLAALGPVFLAAARAGEIVKTGELRRTRFARRHRDLTVWRSSRHP